MNYTDKALDMLNHIVLVYENGDAVVGAGYCIQYLQKNEVHLINADESVRLRWQYLLVRIEKLLQSEQLYCRNLNIPLDGNPEDDPEDYDFYEETGEYIDKMTYEDRLKINIKLKEDLLILKDIINRIVDFLNTSQPVREEMTNQPQATQNEIVVQNFIDLKKVVKQTLSVKAVAFLCYYLRHEGRFIDEKLPATTLGEAFAPVFGRSPEEVRKAIGEIQKPGALDNDTINELNTLLKSLSDYVPPTRE